jgi:hypothetical protein
MILFQQDSPIQHDIVKPAGITLLASTCAFGGTFFFTNHHPLVGAAYLGTVALVGQVAYQAMEKIKEIQQSPTVQHLISVIQLLEIPLLFYYLHAGTRFLPAAVKLEIVAATGYFIAIPLFFHLGIEAWKDPSPANISSTIGVMLALSSGLRGYADLFK